MIKPKKMAFKLFPLFTQATLSVFLLVCVAELSNSFRVFIFTIIAMCFMQCFEYLLISFSDTLDHSNAGEASPLSKKREYDDHHL